MKRIYPRDTLSPDSELALHLAALRGPRTGSPVPSLTSIHARPGRGPYGDPAYPGNCSGLLIRDLLAYYQPQTVLDPMAGSGTCRDVCHDVGIACRSYDLKSGFDATDRAAFAFLVGFDFVWLHPPYWRLVRYSNDPRCLSNAPTLKEFVTRLRAVIRNCIAVMEPTGRIAILMGDMKHDGEYCGLPFRVLNAAAAEGLWLDAPEIIRPSHGATSSKKTYSHAFIPRLHDVCLIFKRRVPEQRR